MLKSKKTYICMYCDSLGMNLKPRSCAMWNAILFARDVDPINYTKCTKKDVEMP